MNLWISAQILIDVLLIIAIIICISRLKKIAALKQSADTRIEDLLELQGALNDLLQESREVSNDIRKEIENMRSLANDTIETLESEKKALFQLSQELKTEAKVFREEIRKNDNLNGKIIKDKYSEAIKLAETGLNAEEISKKTSIPLGEIELALSLRR
jgi:hypothetical protein